MRKTRFFQIRQLATIKGFSTKTANCLKTHLPHLCDHLAYVETYWVLHHMYSTGADCSCTSPNWPKKVLSKSFSPHGRSPICLKSLVFAFKLPNSSYLPEPLNPLHTQLISQVSWPAAPVLGWSSEGPSGFSVAAPKLSNKLPLHVSQAFTLSNLKTLLKTHLFCLASATTWVADSTCTDVLSGVDRLFMYYALLCVCFFIFSILSFRYVCIVSG